MSRSWQISRRAALRGLGTALSLPLLDSMVPAQAAISSATQSELPKRMAFLFVPNGVNLAHWTPTRTGFGYDLPSILTPLKSVQNDVSVLTGLTHTF